MQIYKLTSSQTDKVYVGKTNLKLNRRFQYHKSDYKSWSEGRRQFKSSYFLTEYEDCKIEIIETTNNSLREIYWIQKLNTCNFEHNGDDYFIGKVKDRGCKLGFIYRFEITRNKKLIIEKTSTDKQFLKNFRDKWIKNNQHLFIEK
tara:strand:- start:461 stop:898 length:438 start_codon:yes stop_codon:yes gene_type:complete